MTLSDGDFPRSPGSGKLTPAGQVAQAYKRGLTPSPSASPLPSPAIEYKRKALSDSGHGTMTPSPPATPYYTVFGSTSGRVVAVGGPEDSWDGAGSYISATAFPGLDPSSRTTKISTGSATVGRSLTRKVSERWGRKREEQSEDDRGRSSTQIERRGKRSGSRSAADEAYSPAGDTDWTMSSSEVAPFNNEPRSRRSEPALGGGNKIWKLMKRISTGGLKEKYERNLPPIPPLPPMPDLPPVPRLPKDLQTRSAMSSDGHSDDTGAVSRFMQSRSSLNASQPGSGIPRPSARSLPMPPPIPASQPRASTTTRSSSPVSSSDVASSKYFPKTTSSTRSSTSSFGEDASSAPPPIPDVPSLVGKHIVPPKELSKLDLNVLDRRSLDEKKGSSKPMAFFGTQNIRGADDWTIVNTPAEEKPPSLPHPPRRLPAPSAHGEGSRLTATRRLSETPSIPEFSTQAPINAFAARKPLSPVAEPLAVPAPRRSTDDSTFGRRLGAQASGSVSAASAPVSARDKRTQQRSASLPRVVPEKLKFRNMSEKVPAPLTEKEKADRWDDLLARSERAGGTIHMGTSQQLASDEMSLRYSTSSTQLLKDF
ncbi:hypothetical protein FB45DRAFT_399001 [Roridomyces roridus]|uniref:Uncharacterized protein n=1 Tax=Roridomyces roridus TaxID=1738132 RepID=A0AAD7C3R9_9AGAR|nr:hypothetical protein FB45DRAFT_399001 [Roridomyces roridus]